MPIPQPFPDEEKNVFINRCMEQLSEVDPDKDIKQRLAICFSQWDNKIGEGNNSTNTTLSEQKNVVTSEDVMPVVDWRDESLKNVVKAIQGTPDDSGRDVAVLISPEDLDDFAKKLQAGGDSSLAEVSRDLALKRKSLVGRNAWLQVLNQMLERIFNVTETYDSSKPSRRVEGVLGAPKEVVAIEKLVISIDCSSSMGVEKFNKVLKALEVFFSIKNVQFKPEKVYLFLWAGHGEAKILKVPGKGKKAWVWITQQSFGGVMTEFIENHIKLFNKVGRADLYFVLTDGDFTTGPSPSFIKAFSQKYKRNISRIIWLLTDPYYDDIKGIDQRYRTKKIVVPT